MNCSAIIQFDGTSASDAVDGADSAASQCHNAVISQKQREAVGARHQGNGRRLDRIIVRIVERRGDEILEN